MSKSFVSSLVLAAVATLASAGAASAALTIDLRVMEGSNVSATPKAINVPAVGSVVEFGIFATITGANANLGDEGVQNFFGSIVSTLTSGGSAIGNLSSVTLVPAFNIAPSAQAGTVQNLNGQPGLDVGSTGASADFINPRAASPVLGSSFLVGTATFTVTSLPASGTTELNWVTRTGTTFATWREDGANKAPLNGTYTVGAPIAVVVPEPAALGMAVPALALLARRRRA